MPRLTRKLERIDVPAKNSASTLAVSKPDMGPQSRPSERAALRSSSLEGGYLILAARALGLDTGPMSGFDAAKIDAEFFAGTRIRSNFLVNLGEGDATQIFPRLPRLPFEEAARIL